jgi:uncharacterized protein (TIGR02145 family)
MNFKNAMTGTFGCAIVSCTLFLAACGDDSSSSNSSGQSGNETVSCYARLVEDSQNNIAQERCLQTSDKYSEYVKALCNVDDGMGLASGDSIGLVKECPEKPLYTCENKGVTINYYSLDEEEQELVVKGDDKATCKALLALEPDYDEYVEKFGAPQSEDASYDLAALVGAKEVASTDKLGDCGSDNDKALAYVEADNEYYVCYQGKWNKGSEQESVACTDKNEGDTVMVPRDYIYDTYVCEDGKWTSDFGGDISLDSSTSVLLKVFVTIIKGIPGTVVDERDGKEYRTTTIVLETATIFGSVFRYFEETWLAENLAYEVKGSRCYGDSKDNCEKYGRLYSWDQAMVACPEGWHLPNFDEFNALVNKIIGRSAAVKDLKSAKWSGTDKYGFSALPAGVWDPIGGRYEELGYGSWIWTSETYGHWGNSPSSPRTFDLADLSWWNHKRSMGYSVRCIKDGARIPESMIEFKD